MGSPAWGVLHLEDKPPEHLALEVVGLNCKQPHRTGVNKDLTLKGCTQKFHVHQSTGKKQSLDRRLCQTYLLVSETCGVRVGVCEPYPGDTDSGNSHIWESLCLSSWYWWCHSLINTKTWPCLTICRCQCWDASGQTTIWVTKQPHPSLDRLPKDYSAHASLWTCPLATAQPTRGPGPSSTQQGIGMDPSHQEACTSF